MMNLLQELKGVRHTLDQIVYYGFQQYIRSAESVLHGQPTIAETLRRAAGGAGAGGAHGQVETLTRKVRLCVQFRLHKHVKRLVPVGLLR